MRLEDVEVASPAEGEVQVQHTAIGVNFIDVYDRTGLYPQKIMPGGLGREAAGVVSAVGRRVRGFRVGDRVAYVVGVPGSYAEVRNVPALRVVKIPAGVSDAQAAVLMLKGLLCSDTVASTAIHDRFRLSFGSERHDRPSPGQSREPYAAQLPPLTCPETESFFVPSPPEGLVRL